MKKQTCGCAFTVGVMLCALSLRVVGADSNQYRADEARVKAIAANPEAIGEKELAFLMSHLYYPESITAIAKAKTPAAHAALWKLALDGRDGSFNSAYALVETMTNKLEALKLLASKSPEVQTIALRGIMGPAGIDPVTLDGGGWVVVRQTLSSDSLELRRWAAKVTARDSGREVAVAEKAARIAESMATTLALKDAQKVVGAGGFAYSYVCPLGEDVLAEQAIALGWMKGVTRKMLAGLPPAGPGLAFDGMVIARSIAGDLTMHGELHRVLTNPPSGRLRMAALDQALNWRTVTEADRACLEAVAAADPLQGTPGSDYAYSTGDKSLEGVRDAKIYPARILAKMSLRKLETLKNRAPHGP